MVDSAWWKKGIFLKTELARFFNGEQVTAG
jgi:hypothetical protein